MFSDQRARIGYHRVQWSSNSAVDIESVSSRAGIKLRSAKSGKRFETSIEGLSGRHSTWLTAVASLGGFHIKRRVMIEGTTLRLHTAFAPSPGHDRDCRGRRPARTARLSTRVEQSSTTTGRCTTSRSSPPTTYIANGMLVHNSVYGWRGADVRNISQFEDAFDDVTTIVLDQNYRSTQTILDAANAVIANNPDRKDEATLEREGQRRSHRALPRRGRRRRGHLGGPHDADPARRRRHGIWKDMAAFYRTNAQSRVLEEALMRVRHPVQGGRRHPLLRPARDQGRDGLPAGRWSTRPTR